MALAHAHWGCLPAGSIACDPEVRSKPTGLPVEGTVTDTPLTFIFTDALPSVSSSLDDVLVGIVWPTLKISPGIRRLPCPSMRQT